MRTSNPPPAHIAIDIPSEPPPATPGGPQNRREKVAAWVGATGQQAIVSGTAWGFANKLPVAIGATVGTMIGGPAGAAGGAVVGNLIGGVALGITHYSAEVACNNARIKMGRGFQYQPDPGADSKKFTYNSFIGAFSTLGVLKAAAKTGIEARIGDGKGWAKAFAGLAVDMASSTMGGGIAQMIINDRQHLVGEDGFNSEIKYKELKDKKFDWNEAKTRMKGGAAAGASGSLVDSPVALVRAPASSGAKVVASMAFSAAKTSFMLHTWFNARETFASTPKPAAQPAPAAPTPPAAASTLAAPTPPPAAASTLAAPTPPPAAASTSAAPTPPPSAVSTSADASGHVSREPGPSGSSRYFDTIQGLDELHLLGDIEMGMLQHEPEITEERDHTTPGPEPRA